MLDHCPRDVFELIIQLLSPGDLGSLLCVNKAFFKCLENHQLWEKHFKVLNLNTKYKTRQCTIAHDSNFLTNWRKAYVIHTNYLLYRLRSNQPVTLECIHMRAWNEQQVYFGTFV